MMKYQVLVKTISGKGGEFWEAFKKMPTEPMKGVMVESSWSLFGYWDFVIFFKADSNENSLHFIGGYPYDRYLASPKRARPR